MKLKTILQLPIFLSILLCLLAAPRAASAEQFEPETVAELIAAINAANSNDQPDVIDLGGNTFTLTEIDHTNAADGPTGLPAITQDSGVLHIVTIQNGTIQRSNEAGTPNFRILINESHLILRNVTIRGGVGDSNGGGVFSKLTLEVRDGSLITGNQAGFGGGIFGVYTTVVGSTVSDNFASPFGAGIYSLTQTLTVINSTISGNISASEGAGIYCDCDLSLVNSTVSGNSNGIFLQVGADLEAINSTIADNDIGPNPGAGLLAVNASVSFRNTLLANNRNIPAHIENCDLTGTPISSDGHNLSDDASCNLNGTGDQVNIANAGNFISDLALNGGPTKTHALLEGSTAIDGVGDGACDLGEDQRGELRPGIGSAICDIGAFEFQGELSPATEVTLTGGEGWRFITSPVIGETYDGFLGDLWTQGMMGSNYPAAEFPNLYTFDQQEFDWEPAPGMSGEIGPGNGFIIYVFEDDDFNGTVEAPEEFPKILTSEGSWLPLDGSFAYSGLGYRSGDPDNSYFLLANPHPVPLDFCEFISANIAASVDIWDPAANSGNGDYVNLNCTADEVRIAPFQAYWVRTTAAGPSLEIPTGAYLSGSVNGYFKKPSQNSEPWEGLALTLTVQSHDETFTNTARILLSEDGSPGLDPHDGLKLSPAGLASRWLSFYSMDSENRSYAFQSLSSKVLARDGKISIPLDIETTEAGEYLLEWNLPKETTFAGNYFLRDNHSGQVIELHEDQNYRFELENEQTSKSSAGSLEAMSNEFSPSLRLPLTSSHTSRFELLIAAAGMDGFPELGNLPETYVLDQNYPNPFNPTTVISYQLPAVSQVRLEVYDMLGKRVATLVDRQVAAGVHQVNFNAGNLSSGVYLYRLQTESTVISRKLTVVK